MEWLASAKNGRSVPISQRDRQRTWMQQADGHSDGRVKQLSSLFSGKELHDYN